MKTKEFIKSVEELGFKVEKDNICIFIRNSRCATVAKVRYEEEESICTDYFPFYFLDPKLKKKLFGLLVKYASTQPKDREKPKQFYLRLKGAEHFVMPESCFLNRLNASQVCILDCKIEVPEKMVQTKFTQSEIDQLPKELLEAFDQIEVEDED